MSEDSKPENSGDTVSEVKENREKLVDTAVNFLLNPGIINQPDTRKIAFLRKKGLSEEEITSAYKRAESNPAYNDFKTKSAIPVSTVPPPVLPPPVPVYRHPVSFWSQLSLISSSLIVVGVAMFGLQYIYRVYIEPFLFRQSSKELETIEKQLTKLNDNISQLSSSVASLEESVKLQKAQMEHFLQKEVNEYYPTPLLLKDIKTEIGCVKSMLLNRHQFPSLPKVSPTIPKWQLSETNQSDENEPANHGVDTNTETVRTETESKCAKTGTNGEIAGENNLSNGASVMELESSEDIHINTSEC